MQGLPDETKLDRPTLEKNGIFYFEWPREASEQCQWQVTKRVREYLARASNQSDRLRYAGGFSLVPNFVESLRELLLDNSKLIPSYAEEHLHPSERAKIPKGVIFDDEDYPVLPLKEKDDARGKFEKIFKECRDIARKSVRKIKEHADEHDWQLLMEGDIFKRYQEGQVSLFDRYVVRTR